MSTKNVQFTVATHMLAVLGYYYGSEVTSTILAGSVNAEPSFVRRTVSKLSKAGLIVTTRGKNGACTLARPPDTITLQDIYRASGAPPTFTIHRYPPEFQCPVSANLQCSMSAVLQDAQDGFEERLAQTTLAQFIAAIHKSEKKPKKSKSA